MRRILRSLLVVACAAPAAARDGDVQSVTPLVRLNEGVPNRVVFRDPYAYLAMDTGLAIYDLRTPLLPTRVSHLYLPSPAHDLEVVGNLVYIAGGETGLVIVDIADVARPLVVGSLATAGTRGLEVVGTIAYLAEASEPAAAVHGLRTVDVSNPASPVALGFTATPNGALDVALAGSVAWVALGSELGRPHGLYALDVSNPAAPAYVPGGLVTNGKAVNEVVIAGSIAYLATGFASTGAVVIASVAAPGSPQILSSVALSDGARGLALTGTTLFVAARSLGLLTLNVSDPMAPVMLDALSTGRETVGVGVYPGFAFLAERASIERAAFTLADATFASAVRVLSSVPFAEATATAAGPARGYFLVRDALWIADTTDPALPTWLGVWSPPRGDFSSLDVAGNLAAVGEGDSVHLVDLGNPAAPVAVGAAVLSTGVAVRPLLAGNTLYVVNGRGFESFDVTSPSAPGPLATYSTSGWSAGLAIDGTLGYLVAGNTLHVLDLSVSMAPIEIGNLQIPGEQLYGVAALGTLAVATGYGATLHVFDVTAPSAPLRVATLAGPGGFDVRLSGNRALVAAGAAGLQVVDVSVPASPQLEGFQDTSGSAITLAIEGQNVHLATNEAQHWSSRCDTCTTVCIDTWPVVAPNSLQAVKIAGGGRFHWGLDSGSGGFNLHRGDSKSAIPTLYSNVATFLATTTALTLDDLYAPGPGERGYYQIYPRASCSGASVGP